MFLTHLPMRDSTGPAKDRQFDSALNCTVGQLNDLNEGVVRPILEDLTLTTFFKYFKVDLSVECPFWVMDRMCKSGGGCHVCRCDENEVPLPWRVETTHRAILRPLPSNFKQWNDVDENMWSLSMNEQDSPDATYVNLVDNPESNTGYAGDEPRRIWDAIYKENCFHVMSTDNVNDMCLEERVFYRLISGLNTSITAHVFARWKQHPETHMWMSNQGLWNLVMARFPDRLDNLYFTLDFLLKSVRVAEPFLKHVAIDTGDATNDAHTRQLLYNLARSHASHHAQQPSEDADAKANTKGRHLEFASGNDSLFPTMYNSEFPRLFASPDRVQLKDDLKHMFRNVSNIMNCVGCEKCRVWGKLNTLGIATALKLTLAEPEEREEVVKGLQRNEVVAWINTLSSFSESVHYINKMSVLQPPAHAEAPSVQVGKTEGDGKKPVSEGGKVVEEKPAAKHENIRNIVGEEKKEKMTATAQASAEAYARGSGQKVDKIPESDSGERIPEEKPVAQSWMPSGKTIYLLVSTALIVGAVIYRTQTTSMSQMLEKSKKKVQ